MSINILSHRKSATRLFDAAIKNLDRSASPDQGFENDTVIIIGFLESRINLLEQQLPHGEIMIDIETKDKKIKELEDAVQSLSGDLVKLREAFMESDIDVYDKLFTLEKAVATTKKLARE